MAIVARRQYQHHTIWRNLAGSRGIHLAGYSHHICWSISNSKPTTSTLWNRPSCRPPKWSIVAYFLLLYSLVQATDCFFHFFVELVCSSSRVDRLPHGLYLWGVFWLVKFTFPFQRSKMRKETTTFFSVTLMTDGNLCGNWLFSLFPDRHGKHCALKM